MWHDKTYIFKIPPSQQCGGLNEEGNTEEKETGEETIIIMHPREEPPWSNRNL